MPGRWFFVVSVAAVALVVGYPIVFGDAGPFGFLAECERIHKPTRPCSYPNVGAVLILGGLLLVAGMYFAWWWRYQRGRER